MKTYVGYIAVLLAVSSVLAPACARTMQSTPGSVAPAKAEIDLARVEVNDGPVKAVPGHKVNMVLLPKFMGILAFDQAHAGAQEAHKELENPQVAVSGPLDREQRDRPDRDCLYRHRSRH